MCLPCGPRRGWSNSHYKPHPLPKFDTLEEYLAFLETHPADSSSFRPLPVHLQSTENFVKVVSLHPDVYPKVPQKYQNKAVKAAAGIA